jgi:mono/diheme cytochrome c family protein
MDESRRRATADGVWRTAGRVAGLALAVSVAACASPAQVQEVNAPSQLGAREDDMIAAGRDLVVQRCASCHAIDQSMKSPLREAPPLRTVLAQYDSEVLADDLIEGIQMGHDEMPLFDFTVTAADALVAYLKSLNPGS